MNRKSFYCLYLGCSRVTNPVGAHKIYELVQNTLASSPHPTSKITLGLGDTCLNLIDNSNHQIIQMTNTSLDTQAIVKRSTIRYDQIGYVSRLARPFTDVVTIISAYNPVSETSHGMLYAFRLDSDESASKLEECLQMARKACSKKKSSSSRRAKHDTLMSISDSAHLFNNKVKESFIKRQIFRVFSTNQQTAAQKSARLEQVEASGFRSDEAVGSSNKNNSISSMSVSSSSSSASNSLNNEANRKKLELVENLNREINEKFKSGQPILLPPRDYTEEDRHRGNLAEAKCRASQNPMIVGRDAFKLKLNDKNMLVMDDGTNENENEKSEYALLREQTDEALKLLDDVVNSELADEENNRPLGVPPTTSCGINNTNKPKIFQFIPPGQVERSAQLAQIRADLDQRASGNRPAIVNNEMLFKKNAVKSKVKQHSRKSNASSTSNNSNNKMSMEERAAAIGIRNGVLSKLGQYHPQWMSGSQSGSNFCCEISQAPAMAAVATAKMKLRHTESARQAMAAQQQNKSLKQSLSFLRKEDFVRECSPYYSSDEERKHVNLIKFSPSQESNNKSKVVLKPAQSNHDVSSFYFKDLAPSSKLNRRFFSRNCDQPIMKPVESRNGSSVVLNAYKSEPSLIAATANNNNNKKYRFNDFFY